MAEYEGEITDASDLLRGDLEAERPNGWWSQKARRLRAGLVVGGAVLAGVGIWQAVEGNYAESLAAIAVGVVTAVESVILAPDICRQALEYMGIIEQAESSGQQGSDTVES